MASSGATRFSYHRVSGTATMVVAVVLMLAVETVALHLLLSRWSRVAAWMLTLGSVSAAWWLIADFRAVLSRPIEVDGDEVWFRAGSRWSLRVPRELVAGIARGRPEFGRESLRLTFLAAPTLWVTFKQPVTAEGMYGVRRRVRAVGLAPDDPEGFERALSGYSGVEPPLTSPRA